MTKTVAETLAEHYASLRLEDIPAKTSSDVKVLIRDYLSVALGGSLTGSGKIAAQFAVETGGVEQSTIIGNGAKVPAVHGAFANAIASHSIELDDVDILALYHYSPPVISAALAVAEQVGASGAQFLAACVAGCDMMARASNATNFALRNRGYHTTPTCGVFGATIAAAVLLKMNAEQITCALGLAGAQASGLMEMYGPSMQKRFNPGPAARNGVTSAVMAKMGFTGAATIFEGEHGFCQAFAGEYKIEELTKDLGTAYPIEIEYKPHSCARPIHNAIDCALEVRKQMSGPTSTIKVMKMRRNPAWAHYHLNTTPATYHEAQVSLPYSVAISLIEGSALPPQYQNNKLSEPEVLRLSKMLEVTPDDTLPRGVSCALEVVTEDGAVLTSQVDHPKGSIANPMSEEEMRFKVHMLADPIIGKSATDTLISLVDAVETQPNVNEIMATTVPVK